MSDGYIKLWRKSVDNGWLHNPKLWVFWCYCLMKATHKKHKQLIGFKEIDLEPGQFVFGIFKAIEETRLSYQSVRTCLQTLKSTNNLTIKSTNKYSIISIVNWAFYQGDEDSINNQINNLNNKQLTNKQQTTNNKQECKECKEETHTSIKATKESKNGHVPYNEIKELWNRIMSETELAEIEGFSETRKKHLKARWNHSDKTKSLEWWEKYFNFITESDFLMGRAPGRKWKASFDWVINESNFLKIKEGNYN